jgi:serine/threonine-protein kinase RsbW
MQAEPMAGHTSPAPARRGGNRTRRLEIEATPVAVRDGLQRLFSLPPLCALCAEDRGTAEIVLAEVMNNIAEHAYAEAGGLMTVKIALRKGMVRCEVADSGTPMRGGCPPEGRLPCLCAGDIPAEGGYGWYLIRSLTTDLTYSRSDGRNLLVFGLPLKQ